MSVRIGMKATTKFTVKSYETESDFKKKRNPTTHILPTKKQALAYAEIVGETNHGEAKEFYGSVVSGQNFKQEFIY
jgi:hypothetical protein